MDKLVRLSYIGKSAAEAVASTGAQAAGEGRSEGEKCRRPF